MKKETTPRYDIIGDIHGELAALEALLSTLGYEQVEGSHRHPAGRQVIFVGDFIDRGPDSRSVLHLARNMMADGDALAVKGNHEFNFISYQTPNGKGGTLRPRTERNAEQVKATLDSFAGHEDEIPEFVEWMKTLPFFLDLGGLRIVHASWIPRDIAYLKDKSLLDDAFLRETGEKGSPAYLAVERVLKGLETRLPSGITITDSNGIDRPTIRVKWWGDVANASWEEIMFPALAEVPEGNPDTSDLKKHIDYGEGESMVFFGHYKLKRVPPFTPAPNLLCLDHGLGHEGPATAYRWDGETEIDLEKVVQVS